MSVRLAAARLVASAVTSALFLAGCGAAPAAVRQPSPAGSARAPCHAVVAGLPDRVDGQDRRPVTPRGEYTAAWGDPPIVLRCGVARPAAMRASSDCFEVNRVGWFARQRGDGYVFTTIGRAAYVQVTVPAAYEPASDALVDLATAVRRAPERAGCL